MAKLNEMATLTRDLATRARRLAAGLATDEAKEQVQRYADELDAEANELEQRTLKDS